MPRTTKRRKGRRKVVRGRRSRKSRTDRRQNIRIAKLNKKTKRINKVIRGIQLKNPAASKTWKKTNTHQITAAVNKFGLGEFTCWDTSVFNNVIQDMRFCDDVTSKLTLITRDLKDPTTPLGAHNKIHIPSAYVSFQFRNNGRAPLWVKLYYITPKTDHANSVSYSVQKLIDDQCVGNGGTQTINNRSLDISFTDSEVFSEFWNIKKSESYWLEPGCQAFSKISMKNHVYDPFIETYATGTLAHQDKPTRCIFRVEGPVGSDGTSVGRDGAKLDIEERKVIKVNYEAGVKLKDYTFIDGRDNFTNNAEVVTHATESSNYLGL